MGRSPARARAWPRAGFGRFSGLKDRHAITRQAFTVHLGAKPEPDWNALAILGVRVLGATRHARKLKRGAHRGNRFVIVLRDVRGERGRVDDVLAAIRSDGVPNYFGEQRFGRDDGNLALARQLFQAHACRAKNTASHCRRRARNCSTLSSRTASWMQTGTTRSTATYSCSPARIRCSALSR
jgi:TruD family tRNA pseudouridine synthase